jgi:hypothetical protein
MKIGYSDRRHFFIAYGIILLGAVVSFFVRLVKFSQFGLLFQVVIFAVSIVLLSIMWESLRLINQKLNEVYPFERSISGRIVRQLFLGALVGVTVRFLIYYFGEPRLPFKLDELFIASTWVLYILVTVGINLGFFTNFFIHQWKDSLIVAERLEKEKSQVQFENLKNQLNPHFLFNSLTSLHGLIFENQGLASHFLQHLSKVYRYVLQNKDKNFVPLQIELDFIENYVFLLRTRFQLALVIKFDITEAGRERAIVPATLQTLIENALKHNIADVERPLKIDVLTIGDYLLVSNNLQLRNRVETSNKQGLENIKSLYSFLTEKPVLVERTDDRFAVKIPLL